MSFWVEKYDTDRYKSIIREGNEVKKNTTFTCQVGSNV